MKQLNLGRRRSNRLVKKFFPILFIASIIFIVAVIFAIFSGPGQAIRFIFPNLTFLDSNDGKVNVLVLGNAGGVHEGAYLTDTIIVASYDLDENKIYLISLPRDLWIDKVKGKLNSVYEIGQSQDRGLGFTKDVVENILDIPIHYAIRIDFRGFIKAIDEIGGVEVSVANSFEDPNYPIEGRANDLCGWVEEEKEFSEEEAKKLNIPPGKRRVLTKDGAIATDSAEENKGFEYFPCRYERISFKSGLQKMNGETALKFVRSRMGTNNEGSDFARSKRQQAVLEALRKKVLSLETLFNPGKISAFVQALDQSLEMDMSAKDILEFYRLVKKIASVRSFVISADGPNALLINPPLNNFGGAWVLLPKDGNFKKIQEYVQKILRGEGDEASSSARPGGF